MLAAMPTLIDNPHSSLPTAPSPISGSSSRVAAPISRAIDSPAQATGWRRRTSRAALAASVAATALVIVMGNQLSNGQHVAGVVVACAAYLLMLSADRRWGGLTVGFVVAAIAAATVGAVAVMPRTGSMWSYAMYGRMLGVHHVSPWTHGPAAFPHDPFRSLVGRTWAHTPSVYGPVFTAVSGAAAVLLGTAVLPTRLFYQGLAALALGGGAWLVWRHTRSAAAVAFLAIHPLIAMYIVNAGRNDILVGVAMLAAVYLAARDRPGAAGFIGGLGALVKVTGLLGLVSLLVVTAVRGDRRSARRIALAAGGTFGAGYLVAGTTALLAPMQTAGALYSRGSAWNVLSALGLHEPTPHVALAVLGALVVAVIIRHRRSPAGTAVAASSGMLAIGAAYTLPGYTAWALPAAALDHRSRVSRIVAASGLVLVTTYEVLRHPVGGSINAVLHALAAIGGPLLMVALVLALLRTRHPSVRHILKESIVNPHQIDTNLTSPIRDLRTLVVLPTLNEAENIETVLVRIRASLPAGDVLVVDDGSTDGTPEFAEGVGRDLGHVTVFRRVGPRGLGSAYRAGFARGLAEGYDVIVQMDADLSHDPADLPVLVAGVGLGADLVVGSRYVPGGETPGWPERRRVLSRVGGWYARTLLGLRVSDVTSGFRAYRSDLLRAIDVEATTTTGFGFQIDMTDRARNAGAVIDEVPIVFRDRTAGTSKMSSAIIREALLMVTRRAIDHRIPGRRVGRGRVATPTLSSEVESRRDAEVASAGVQP